MSTQLFTWQTDLATQLCADKKKLPHAVLFYGPRGIGKYVFAKFIAQALLCESPASDGCACNQCASCKWFVQGHHPDYELLEPESNDDNTEKKASTVITVDQVRELSDFVNTSSHRNRAKIILVHPAEAMNIAAANALLKTLEEPPAGVFIFLITHQIERLLPTIRSRCRKIAMPVPDFQTSEKWLKEQGVAQPALYLAQAGYTPLKALELDLQQSDRLAFLNRLAEPAKLDPVALAQTMQNLETAVWMNWLVTWIYDIALAKRVGSLRYNIDFKEKIDKIKERTIFLDLIRYYRQLISLKPVLNHPLNMRLLAEQVLINYTKVF
jgi:DNA polymerase-3 subunit delta'